MARRYTYWFGKIQIYITLRNGERATRAKAPLPVKYVYRPKELTGSQALLVVEESHRVGLTSVQAEFDRGPASETDRSPSEDLLVQVELQDALQIVRTTAHASGE